MKSIEKFFDMNMGSFCGVLIREKKAKKLAKLLYRQNQEIKELLADDLDQLEVSDWTLAYPDGKQTPVHYYTPSTDEEKLRRINLIDRQNLMKYIQDVFAVSNRSEVEGEYMEWYEATKFLKESETK